jgi:predicted Rossmann-fold nucleotide-binding protein
MRAVDGVVDRHRPVGPPDRIGLGRSAQESCAHGASAQQAVPAPGLSTRSLPMLGEELTARGIRLVSGGAGVGLMADLSSGFVALPCDYGTPEEFDMVLTWSRLGPAAQALRTAQRRGLLHLLFIYLDHAVDERFIGPQNRALVQALCTRHRCTPGSTARTGPDGGPPGGGSPRRRPPDCPGQEEERVSGPWPPTVVSRPATRLTAP